jgi:hypothetical protein
MIVTKQLLRLSPTHYRRADTMYGSQIPEAITIHLDTQLLMQT